MWTQGLAILSTLTILVECRGMRRGSGDMRELGPTVQGDYEAANACRNYPLIKRSPLSCCVIPRIANATAVAECEVVFSANQGSTNTLCDRQKCIFGKSNLLDNGDIVSIERFINYLRNWRNVRKHWTDAVDHVINNCLFIGEAGPGRCQPIDLIHCTINTLFNHCPDEEFNFNAPHCVDISHFMQYCAYDLGTHLSYLQNLAESIPDSNEED